MIESPLHIDADIRTASTLPGRFYRDTNLFERSRDRIFAQSWQLVSDDDCVRIPGQVHPFTFLEGCVDEPLVLTRTQQDEVHCLSNVCTHRGNLVVLERGRASRLRCAYHGRRFALDGTFEHMPEFEDVADFPRPCENLPRLPLARLGRLLFTALDPAFPFDALVADVTRRLGWLPWDEHLFDASRSRDYLVRAHWALYCDNYLEGFHVPFVHDALGTTIDYGTYRTELFRWSNVQIALASDGSPAFDLPASSPDHGERIAAYYYFLFPNVMLNFYPWGLSVNVVRPLAVDRTKVSFLAYVRDPSLLDEGAGGALDRVEREDEFIVEACQRGMASRLYDRGRYAPGREQGVHHFHRLLTASLRDERADPTANGAEPT